MAQLLHRFTDMEEAHRKQAELMVTGVAPEAEVRLCDDGFEVWDGHDDPPTASPVPSILQPTEPLEIRLSDDEVDRIATKVAELIRGGG